MADIQQLIEADKALLLSLNGSDSLFWDGFMWTVTDTKTWIPAVLVLLYVVFKNNRVPQGIVITLMFALCVTLADQFASGLCKPYFARFRPTQDPELMYLVQTVNDYRGGLYGFISSHAANTFAVAMFASLLVRYLPFTCMMFLWAMIPSYSVCLCICCTHVCARNFLIVRSISPPSIPRADIPRMTYPFCMPHCC